MSSASFNGWLLWEAHCIVEEYIALQNHANHISCSKRRRKSWHQYRRGAENDEYLAALYRKRDSLSTEKAIYMTVRNEAGQVTADSVERRYIPGDDEPIYGPRFSRLRAVPEVDVDRFSLTTRNAAYIPSRSIPNTAKPALKNSGNLPVLVASTCTVVHETSPFPSHHSSKHVSVFNSMPLAVQHRSCIDIRRLVLFSFSTPSRRRRSRSPRSKRWPPPWPVAKVARRFVPFCEHCHGNREILSDDASVVKEA